MSATMSDQSKPSQQSANPTPPTEQGVSTLSVHAGEDRQKVNNAITDSVVLASTFTFEDTQSIISFIENGEDRGEYGRYGVPGEKVVERKLAALEGAEEATVYSSGMAAFVGVLNSTLSSGDEIVFFDECYHRSREYCRTYLSQFGVVTKEVKTGDYDAMEAAITPKTKLLVSESPTNPHRASLIWIVLRRSENNTASPPSSTRRWPRPLTFLQLLMALI